MLRLGEPNDCRDVAERGPGCWPGRDDFFCFLGCLDAPAEVPRAVVPSGLRSSRDLSETRSGTVEDPDEEDVDG